MVFKPFAPKRLRRRIFSQLWMLALQFILGMLLNLIGEKATGTAHTAYFVILVLHILNAIGLVEGAIYIALKEGSKLSWFTAITVTGTLCSGILTVRTGQEAWSFVMACGFLASAWLYIVHYLQIDRAIRASA